MESLSSLTSFSTKLRIKHFCIRHLVGRCWLFDTVVGFIFPQKMYSLLKNYISRQVINVERPFYFPLSAFATQHLIQRTILKEVTVSKIYRDLSKSCMLKCYWLSLPGPLESFFTFFFYKERNCKFNRYFTTSRPQHKCVSIKVHHIVNVFIALWLLNTSIRNNK